ncbi:MAG TPA: hypothetical protein VHR72_04525, partial [Gemmataceae bacterium]|nr:hypothetical protein [Gemmataceae bacterium]
LTPGPSPPARDSVASAPSYAAGGEGSNPAEPIRLATATPALDRLLIFRSVHPLYGAFLLDHLGIADRDERVQIFESVLEIPRAILRAVRVPLPDDLPPGPLQRTRVDEELIRRGLIIAPVPPGEDEEDDDVPPWFEPERPPTLAEKMRLWFDALYPDVGDVSTQSVWAAGELLRFGGNFNKFVQSKDLVKQEGIVFRHFLRLILLCEEFRQLTPPGVDPRDWQSDLRDLGDRLTESCRTVDPQSTDEMIVKAHAADMVEGETPQETPEADDAGRAP